MQTRSKSTKKRLSSAQRLKRRQLFRSFENLEQRRLLAAEDLLGPKVSGLETTTAPSFDLFSPLPTDRPLDLVSGLSISITDPGERDSESLHDALDVGSVQAPGRFQLVGDSSGVIPITGVTVINDAANPGNSATGRIELSFAQPLPDDRYTLTVFDGITDSKGNALDGEANAIQPLEIPQFPSGDGISGGDFVARFTVDSRPEVGVVSNTQVFIDTNGNFQFDPFASDFVNRDLTFQIGRASDEVFAGNFTKSASGTATGFDKLAAFGYENGQLRWLLDTTDNGVANLSVVDTGAMPGLPVAGRFDNNDGNGDEVGLFTGTAWQFDTNHDFRVDQTLNSDLRGYPIVGDFDGDGYDDLGTWTDNRFQFDLTKGTRRGWDGRVDATIDLGFAGVKERPMVADMDQDGIDDLGLWVPDGRGGTPADQAEMVFLVSGDPQGTLRQTGTVNTLSHPFTPSPFGNDLAFRFGDRSARPIVGNFHFPASGVIDNNPQAEDDAFTVVEDSTGNVLDVLANDSVSPFQEGTLTITAASSGSAGGSISVSGNGQSITYSPAPDFFGNETFTYTVRDNQGRTAQATVSVTVTNENDPPTAADDAFSVDENSGDTVLDVLANDSSNPDPNETLTITAVGTPDNGGTVTITNGGADVTYAPAADFFGTETFTYTIDDGNGATATATVTVTVVEVTNNPPTANEDAFTVSENSTNNVLDPLANDSTAPDTGETLTITAVGQPSAGGTVTISQDGLTVIYTPATNFFGQETFTYTIDDGNGGTDQSNVLVTVDNVNDPPTAVDDTFTVAENSTSNLLDVLANDTIAPDTGETLTIIDTGATSAGGSVVVTQDGLNLLYTPPIGFFGTETFTYTIDDGNGGTDMATVTMQVTQAGNNDPTANDDSFTVAEDSSATTFDVLANDSTFPDIGELLKITAVGQTSNGGTVTIAQDNMSVSYTPAADFFGTDTFTYTIDDGNGGTDTATVTVTVFSVNDDPTANDDNFTVDEDSSTVTFNVLANDTIAPDVGETLTITAVGATSNGGTVSIIQNGASLSYAPAANFFGTETFTYTINDGLGGTDTATVTVTVTPVNDDPTAVDDSFQVEQNSVDVTLDVLANDSDSPDTGETLTITNAGTPDNGGTVSVAGDGLTLIYSPAQGFLGTETFSYTISDGNGGTAQGTVTVTVFDGNNPPTAVDDSFTVDEDSGPNSLDVLANDSTAPDVGETLTVTSVGTPDNGGMVVIAQGGTSLTYTPAADFTGTETFVYTINDGNGGTDTATVTITVNGVNDPPEAVDDAVSVAEDSTNNLLNVLANDSTGPDVGETLTIIGLGPLNEGGTAIISQDSMSILYTPAPNFFGSEAFTYTIDDGNGGTDTATVVVTVMSVNDDPTATDDAFSVEINTDANPLDVLANDSIAPDVGETLTITGVGTPSNGGFVQIAQDGLQIFYTPATDFTGTETFNYTIEDGNGGMAIATVTMTVQAGNSNPTAVDDAFNVAEDSVDAVLDVLDNDSTAPDVGETLTITAVGTPDNGGSVEISQDGLTLLYTPATDFFGTETFTYTIDDGNGGTDTGTVTVTVDNENDPPTAVDDAFTVADNSTNNLLAVLENDSFAPDVGETLLVNSAGQPDQGGTVLISQDGTALLYTPAIGFSGTETFTYTISDGNGGTDTATVTVTVNDVMANPDAVDDAFTVDEDSVDNSLDVLANDSTVPGSGPTLTIQSVGTPSDGGMVSIAGDNLSLIYTPAADFFGTETFTYTIDDGDGGMATATVTMTVNNLNDDPTAVDDGFMVVVDSVDNTLDVLANDSDAPDAGETLTILNVGTPDNGGTVSVAGDNLSLIYTPAAAFLGTETFTYEISDGNGGTATATVTVQVSEAVNNDPTANDDAFSLDEDAGPQTLDVLANDSTAPDTGETLTIIDVSTPDNNGMVTIAGDGLSLEYTSMNDFFGTETFTYTIDDGNGGTDTATVTITVANVNDDPVALADDFGVEKDSTDNTLDVLANDSIAPDVGETLTITAVGTPDAGGSVSIAGDSLSLVYTPLAGFVGTETFTYTIDDGNGGTNTATVTVTVTGPNVDPTANDDGFSLDENSADVTLDVLANDSTAPDVGETLTITGVSVPDNGGSVAIAGDGLSLIYTPEAQFVGTETFTYTIDDGNGGTDTATVTVTVNEVILFTPSTEDLWDISQGSSVTNDSGVIATSDIDNLFGATEGTSEVGYAVFSDGEPAGTVHFVEWQTTAPIDLHSFTLFATHTDDPLGANLRGFSKFTLFADGSPIYEIVTSNPYGDTPAPANTIIESNNNKNSITVAANVSPVTAQNFRAEFVQFGGVAPSASGPRILELDGFGTFHAEIPPVNGDGVTAEDDAFTVDEDTTDNSLDVLANDQATAGTLQITGVSATNNGGTVAIVQGGAALEYTPAADFAGTETFTYTVSNGLGQMAQATVTITVNDLNDDPSAANDVLIISEDSIDVPLDVLQNDSTAPDVGETLTIASVTTPNQGGSVMISNDGLSLIYTPVPDFFGLETFSYTVNDGRGGMATAEVTVQVDNVNDDPTANDDMFAVVGNTVNNILDVLANDTSAPDDVEQLEITAVSAGTQGGTIDISEFNKTILYTPAEGFVGTEIFTYTITDGLGGTSMATVEVEVSAPGASAASNPEASLGVTYTNSDMPLDVNNDDNITAHDVLLVINALNNHGGTHTVTSMPISKEITHYYYDVNGDGYVSPHDALWVINHLNANNSSSPVNPAPAPAPAEPATSVVGTAPVAAPIAPMDVEDGMSDALLAAGVSHEESSKQAKDMPHEAALALALEASRGEETESDELDDAAFTELADEVFSDWADF